jgi:hypothetical protein
MDVRHAAEVADVMAHVTGLFNSIHATVPLMRTHRRAQSSISRPYRPCVLTRFTSGKLATPGDVANLRTLLGLRRSVVHPRCRRWRSTLDFW